MLMSWKIRGKGMTLDEVIIHCEDVANTPYYTDKEPKCYSEHRQLAEWLKELKKYREWLNSFNPDSATECFTAVRELRSFVGRDINIPTKARAESEDKEI